MRYAEIAVLIPAYKPDGRMVALVTDLLARGFRHIIVVNDGSGAEYDSLYEQCSALGATVVTHEVNRGKGAALKSGIAHILQSRPMSIVTADADGQHAPSDIEKIADALIDTPGALVLGTRTKKEMPIRSRIGNTLTTFIFGLLTGIRIEDTQTGLRGLPKLALHGFSQLSGDRYEYEMNMLLYARHHHIGVIPVHIATIYIDNNKGSHFSAFYDGARIYGLLFRQILTFMGSSMIAGLIDTGVYTLLQLLFPHLTFMAIGVARALSSLVNYFLNREIVFHARTSVKSVVRYILLVAFILTVNYYLISFFKYLGVPFLPSKLLADFVLFFVNYHIQQSFIFRDER